MNLQLYMMNTCPYCRKVLTFLDDNDIKIPKKNILESPDFRDELIKIGGKGQVPCLVIDGKAMYESDDIIQWFIDNYQKD